MKKTPAKKKTVKKQKFYYRGHFFSTEKEFFDYVGDWPFQKLTEHEFARMMDDLATNLWGNCHMHELEITNGAMNELIEDTFLSLLQKILVPAEQKK